MSTSTLPYTGTMRSAYKPIQREDIRVHLVYVGVHVHDSSVQWS